MNTGNFIERCPSCNATINVHWLKCVVCKAAIATHPIRVAADAVGAKAKAQSGNRDAGNKIFVETGLESIPCSGWVERCKLILTQRRGTSDLTRMYDRMPAHTP